MYLPNADLWGENLEENVVVFSGSNGVHPVGGDSKLEF